MNHKHYRRTMEDSIQELTQAPNSSFLHKAPLPYTGYDLEEQKEQGLPDLMNSDELMHIKTVKLPNGLEYRQFRARKEPLTYSKRVHAIYAPGEDWEPLAYLETQHAPDETAPGGYHKHSVNWAEVQPQHRGKGLGRQVYLAALVHGPGHITSDERVSPEAHKMWESFKTYPGLGGKISKYPKGNELLFRPGLVDKYSERHHVFVRDPSKLDHEKMFPRVNLHSLAASEKEDDILKAVDKSAWNRILKGHNKGVREDVVDSAGHIAYFKNSHKEYLDSVLNHPEVKTAEPNNRDAGVSPKMIHRIRHEIPKYGPEGEIPEPTYMAKPYHSNLERWATTWQKHPIKGWASLTTRKLFEAAKLSDLCEDISAHTHNGVPLVISKFHPQAEEAYHSEEPFIPHEVAKITIMDFLTNNQDRHAGNIMRVGHSPLAIDHERNFQYFKAKSGDRPNVSPYYAFDNSGFRWKNNNLPNQIARTKPIQQNLIDWWADSRHNIKKEMQKNLKFIKDPAVKKHVEDNFNQRWEWVNKHMDSGKPHLMFNHETDGVKNIPFPKPKKDKK